MSENFRRNNIAQSIFEKNYNQISEPKKEILNQKYNCSICLEIIKHENPYLCYNCQKIFHNACLKNWNERQKQLNKPLSCPNCRNEMPLDKWKVFRNYDETRTKDAQILNQAEKSFNSNEYIDKSMNLFQIALNKLNIIHPNIESQINHKLKNLIEEFKYNLINPSLDEISTVIIEELDLIEEYISNLKKCIQKEEEKYKNEINLKYLTENEGNEYIFGTHFVENNANNISLIINGEKSKLIDQYYLKKGENNVTICIKNTLTNLSSMFYNCKTLYNIDELKYLNTANVTDFSFMFRYCKISNIKSLENWDTSKSKAFNSMFDECKLITNIEPLKNWKVSKCESFAFMFGGCNITNIKPLESWNVSNGKDFNGIFTYNLISDIKPLEKWDISNASILGGMFFCCKNLSDISPLKNWNVSNVKDLHTLFYLCRKLSDISPIKNWNVSKCEDISRLFSQCKKLSDISPLKNWNVSNVKDFTETFYQCPSITDIKPLEKWNVSNGINFEMMFTSSGISDLKPIKDWNVANGKKFSAMFAGCKALKNEKILQNWKISKNVDFRSLFNYEDEY